MAEREAMELTYPGTDVPRNHALTTDPEYLERFERRAVGATLARLADNPVRGKFDLAHYTEIHSRLFHEVYPFSGAFRTQWAAKNNPLAKNEAILFPLPHEAIPLAAEALKYHLPDPEALREMGPKALSHKLADVASSLHYTHVFADGNSRAGREFTRTLAMSAGYELDWDRLAKAPVVHALFAHTFERDTEELPRMLERALVNKSPDPDVQRRYDEARPAQRPWRGTLTEALERSASRATAPAVFVPASWEEVGRVRPSSPDDTRSQVALVQKLLDPSGEKTKERAYGVRMGGAVYSLMDNQDTYLRLSSDRHDYPEKLQRAVDRYFEKSPSPDAPSRAPSRPGPDIDGL